MKLELTLSDRFNMKCDDKFNPSLYTQNILLTMDNITDPLI